MNEFSHWNLLVFVPSDPDDPRWLVATVSTVTAVRHADIDAMANATQTGAA